MDPRSATMDEAGLMKRATALFGDVARDAVGTYRSSRAAASPAEILSAMTTDSVFRIPAIRLAEAQQKAGGSVWMYLFDWATPAMGGRFGSCHALEIPFVFDNLRQPGAALFVGDQPPQELARSMNAAWAGFARTGSPEGPAGQWPAYEPGPRSTMVLGDRIGVQEDPRAEERAWWEGLK
jgi:para-nitrobenzyl esterase